MSNDEKRIKAFKAMDKNMQCRGFQYEVGKEYSHKGEVSLCGSGFHACKEGLDVLNYYPIDSRFFEVELYGEIEKGEDKVASSHIKVKAEISFGDMVSSFFSRVIPLCKTSSNAYTSGDESHANTSGKWSHAGGIGISSKARVEHENGWLTVANWIYSDKEKEWQIKEMFSVCPGMKIHTTTIEVGVWYWFEDGTFKNSKEA